MFETTNQPWNILETIGYNGIEWDMMGYNIDWNIYIWDIIWEYNNGIIVL